LEAAIHSIVSIRFPNGYVVTPKQIINSDCQQFHIYQQIEQNSHLSKQINEYKKNYNIYN